ncbi:MAG TPA: valine--tRNA ligase [Sphingobium sp.]
MTEIPLTELAKTFDPAAIEAKWYAHWERNGLFRPERPDATPFTIVNPPPNVTGSLHIGHALDNSLQDIVIRHERLKGKDALWVVGTDHAGIATQMVVERQMALGQDKRTNYTREGFIEKVWAWKAESGGTITGQLRRLGCSMDWSREQFTMDPHFTRAVVKVFVDLHRQGLIYRDKRLVNWDPGLKTAISDLEVETREIKGKFWHFRYPLADGVRLDAPGLEGRDYIVVATTRPETMLADMAVAVNAADERYKSVIGKFVKLPITGRLIPIVADDHADPELGSGAVKITPGHDFNDFEVGKRAGIAAGDMYNMFDADANVVQVTDGLIPAEYLGLHRFRTDGVDGAREKVVEALRALDLLDYALVEEENEDEGTVSIRKQEKIEDRVIQTPYGDRSGVVIEPWLTDQWYVDAATLAKPAIEAVRSGTIEIVPKTWEKTYFNWMENIQPWCVSRQLWWGHRIPAWFDEDGNIFVAETEEGAQAQAGNRKLARDEDVLDTWFSSALWPFATLGWPDTNAPLVERHYPNDLLVSGFDILFFWNARMAMQGIHFMGENGAKPLAEAVPWKRMYLHGLVRATDGQKMSKSKGNVVDPLLLIDKYGADALRFFMAAMESQGRDVKMDEKRVEGYRNFATKLWNATRFAMSNGIGASSGVAAPIATSAVNKWIVGAVVETVAALDKALADLRFDAAANAIYHFVWDQFCDWYLELIKPVSMGEERGSIDDETRAVAGWVLDQILVMLHPFMPFITEELWEALGARQKPLIVAQWPAPGAAVDADAKAEVEWLIKLVGEVRTARNELNVPPGARVPFVVEGASETTLARLGIHTDRVTRLARIERVEAGSGEAQVIVDEATYTLQLGGIIDIAAEKARLTKALEATTKEAKALAGRLGNPAFVEKAKPEAVDKARADHAEKSADAERLAAAIARLG